MKNKFLLCKIYVNKGAKEIVHLGFVGDIDKESSCRGLTTRLSGEHLNLAVPITMEFSFLGLMEL